MMISGVLFALLLGAFIFLVLPRGSNWQRIASAVVFVMLVGVVYAGSVELLSRPKPLRLEWRHPEKARVLGAQMREGEAIYVWLQVEGSQEPRAYALPWSVQMAEQLQEAMRKGQATGTPVEVSQPFGSNEAGTEGGKPKFYARPQQRLPDKNYGGADPVAYEASPQSGAH